MFTDLYSPLQQLRHARLSQLWIKRDDLIDPYISGNKWRKLKYILEDASTKGKNHLVTFGGAYSNHLVATAAAASRSGLKATAFVRGEQVNNEMLVLCSLYGMELIFTDRETYKDKTACYTAYAEKHADTYFIDEGGASAEAVRGCAEIITELPGDTAHLFCAAGTGTTAAGLLQGIQKAGLTAKLHVIPVLKGGEFIRDEIAQYVPVTDQLVLHTDYHFGGYAKTKPDLLKFIRDFTAAHGILIDPVYTAKLFFAIYDLAEKNYFREGEKIIALHTGGLLGIMGMKDKLI
ncbi:1-aminocyclopropane-1-carboxylate deaminase/D-cysteine desulfhydrase [Pedobacter cryoconitis]|uniref:1-aminocyclopropane-1-carboxylate deaminase n=1 Tax=Pedobacter cryoconitis TaxID=188932 RepID=A0A7X0MIR1_9SPHI|nr:pyridoxal-phosphate dependent enzyme [Pedobacter cryoconitis]MBB6500191.1 1-aminocyclopropane-1-carboxylate deaminase [Pedobacter cryoconitis]